MADKNSFSGSLVAKLAPYIPEELCRDLVGYYVALRRDVATATLEKASPGKFVETVVQVMQYLESGTYDQAPPVESFLKGLESRTSVLPDDLRLGGSRVARGMYTIRSKRSIVHKGEVDPNLYDLRYLLAGTQWILSELVRHVLSTDMASAEELIATIQMPVDLAVEDFGERRLVLAHLPAQQEALLLLHHYYPDRASTSQLLADMDQKPKNTVRSALAALVKKRLIEGSGPRGYLLTQLGHREATVIHARLEIA